jgi:hypothetical protein
MLKICCHPIYCNLNSLLHVDVEVNSTGTLPHVDAALGSVKMLPLSALGSMQPVEGAECPLLGSLLPPGALLLAGDPAPGEASPRLQGPRSPLSPADGSWQRCRVLLQGHWRDGSGHR